MSKERFSRSEKIHTRRQKAADRQDMTKVNQLIEANSFLWRLATIKKLLKPENPKLLVMNDMEKAFYHAELEIEQSWLELKCGKTTPDLQKQLLSDYMDNLQQTMPDVHKMLVGDEVRPSIAREIHDRIFPPKPAGLPVKR